MKKGERYTSGELIKKYQSIRKKHGDKAKSSSWICKNKYQWLYAQVKRNHGLTWQEFKQQAGFDDTPLNRLGLGLKDLIKEYQKIRKNHGDQAASSEWVQRSRKNRWIYDRIQNEGLTWQEFKQQAGFDDTPLNRKNLSLSDLIKEYQKIRKNHGDKAKSNKWVVKNGYSWLHWHVLVKNNLEWDAFKQKAGFNDIPFKRGRFSLNELIKEYQSIAEKHGDKAKSSRWMIKNGYSWLYQQTKAWGNLSWKDFLKLCEGHFIVDKDDLMI